MKFPTTLEELANWDKEYRKEQNEKERKENANDKPEVEVKPEPEVEVEPEPKGQPKGTLLDGQTVSEAKEEVANPDSAFEKEIVFSRKRDKLIHVRMTEQEKITAETMANYHKLPISAYIRALIKQDMRRNRQVTKVKEAGGDID